MIFFRRTVKVSFIFAAALMFALSGFSSSAQQEAAVVTVGSGIVAPLAESIAASTATNLSVNVTGASRGFELFCGGSADLALSTRPISAQEEAACAVNEVSFLELLAGFHAMALVSSQGATFSACLTGSELNLLFAPSSQGTITDWSQINLDNPSEMISLIVPASDTPLYSLLDQQIEGEGIRTDVITAASSSEALALLAETPNALAVINFPDAAASGDSVRIHDLNTTAAGCVAPQAESFADRTYSAANDLYFYANEASVTGGNPELASFLSTIVSEDTVPVIENAGFTAPTTLIAETNRSILETMNTGREFSRYVTAYQIPQSLFGTVTIGGSPSGSRYVDRISTAFTSTYPSVTITKSLLGEADGFRRFCNGEIDMVVAFSEFSEEQLSNCAALNVTPITIDLGRSAVILLGNASSSFLECLTIDQIGRLWQASDSVVTTWDQVDPAFPSETITLFSPESSGFTVDLLLLTTAGNQAVSRVDPVVIVNPDPLYRAAATANVEGSVSLMTYSNLQTVLESGQVNVTPVSVDAGSGCVAPTSQTIADGSYPLTRPVRLIVNQNALTRTEVQSILWFLASDERYNLLANNGIHGLAFSDMAALRNRLQDEFSAATALPSQIPTAETTAVPEATNDATVEPEVTAEATQSTGGSP